MADASQGAQSGLYVEPGDSPYTFDSSSERYEFLRESFGAKKTILGNEGIRGTRSEDVNRSRYGQEDVTGTIVLQPSPADLDLWLPRILGDPESTDTFALAETLPAFAVMFDRVAKVFTYTDCKVNKATFRASQGGVLELELDLIGKSFSIGNAGTAPSVSLGTDPEDQPYVLSDAAFTLAGSARETSSFELVIDNLLNARFTNSNNATSITPQGRMVTLKTKHPYTSDETDLLEQALYGAAGTIVLTPTGGGMSGVSTTFTFGRLQVPDTHPGVPGKSEIMLDLDMVARMTGSTRELVVTHDPVPA